MADDQNVTVVGNLTADPELRFTPSGAAVANFTVAKTPRAFDRQSNEWKDRETLFFRCAVWREQAENMVESLHKGMRVVVVGKLESKPYEDKQGNKRDNWEIDVEDVAPSLKYATAKVTRTAKGGSGGGGGGFSGGGGTGGPSRGGGRPQGDQGRSGGGFSGGGGGYSQGGGGRDAWNQEPGQQTYDFGQPGGDEPPF